ncbi:hypothetical protein L2728_04055 [Shewanella chilikensis]|uniref:Uncharacterized protein n=1 Tax=Shewanella putrefaciens (strain 200) TaxID=399804 RepID=E6XK88_SHEP2|nr:hypothetical protein [Shewanella chilikensis]MCL1161060.1 hypothetical protein [Shewanella chilikensis]
MKIDSDISDAVQLVTGYKGLCRIVCPKILEKDFRIVTLYSLKQLIQEMPNELWKRYEIIEHRAYHPRYKIDPKLASIHRKSAAVEYLKQQKILTECGFSAAINTIAKPTLSDTEALRYRRYQALVIVSCLQLYIIGGHNSAIDNALREIRLIATDKNHMLLLSVLPNIDDNQDLGVLIDTLRDLRTSHFLASIDRGLGFLCVAIYDAYRFAKGITRYRKSTKLPAQGHYVNITPIEKVDETSIVVEELILYSLSEEELPSDETQTPQKHRTLRVSDTNLPHKSLYLRAELNKRFTEQLAVRQLSLPCSFEQATDWDIEHLVKNAFDDHSPAALWLLLGLVCGGIPGAGDAHRNLKVVKDWPCLVLEHSVPSSRLDNSLQTLLSSTHTRIVLPLPAIIKGLEFNVIPPSEDDLSEHLKSINDKYKTRLTLGRVTRYLEHWFVNNGIDAMFVALLRGHDYKKRPSLAYCNFPLIEVANVHRKYINHLFDLAGVPFEITSLRRISTQVGSSLLLPEHVLHNLFNKILSPEAVVKNGIPIENIFEFHNHYVCYVWALLSFVVGHRDVSAPLGTLADVNISNRTWWISDKENRNGLTARTLVIPPTAVKQVELYIFHINALWQRSILIHPALAKRCETTLDGTGNLLFFIFRDESGALIPKDISPRDLKKHLGKRMPFQRNWARHHLRSILHSSGLPPSVIDGWMGHEEIGEEIFGHHSGLSIRALEQVADVIEQHLNHHKIEALTGWQTR